MSKRINSRVVPTLTKRQKRSPLPTTQPESPLCSNLVPIVDFPVFLEFHLLPSDILDLVFDTCSSLYQFILSKTTLHWNRKWRDTATGSSFYWGFYGYNDIKSEVVSHAVSHCISHRHWDLLDWVLALSPPIEDPVAIFSAANSRQSHLVPRLCSLGFKNSFKPMKVCELLVEMEDLQAIKALDASNDLVVGSNLCDDDLVRNIVYTGNLDMILWFIKDHKPKTNVFNNLGQLMPLQDPLESVAVYAIVNNKPQLLDWLRDTLSFVPDQPTYWANAIHTSIECLKWLRNNQPHHGILPIWDSDGWPACTPGASNLLIQMKFDVFKFAVKDGMHYTRKDCDITLLSVIGRIQQAKKDGNYGRLHTTLRHAFQLLRPDCREYEADKRIEECVNMVEWIDSNLSAKWQRQQ